jgi:hypothetical protein
MDNLVAYIIVFFAHFMTANERRAHQHLLSAEPLTETEQRFCDGIAWEEARGRAVPEKMKSFMARRRSGLSDDPEVLRLASGGLKPFFDRTAKRILAEERDNIFLNNCPVCGALARTPKARQCRVCGHDWHTNPATEIRSGGA